MAHDDRIQRSSEDRMRRGAARFVGAAMLVYGVAAIPAISAQSHTTARWWTILAVVLVFGPSFALVLASWSGTAFIRASSAVLAVGYELAALLLTFAWTGPGLAPSESFWLTLMPALVVMSVAAAWPPVVWLVVLGVVSVSQTAVSIGTRADALPLITEFGFALGMNAVFTCAAFAVVRTGAILDRTTAEAVRQAASAASMEARAADSTR